MSWPERRKASISWLGLPLGGLLALAVAVIAPWDEAAVAPTSLESAALDPRSALLGPAETAPSAAEMPVEPAPTRAAALRSGQTLGALFAELGLSGPDAHQAAEAARRFVDPRSLRPGTQWTAFLDDRGALTRFELALAGRGALRLDRAEVDWTATFREYRREVRPRTLTASLDGSLEASIERAGADGMLAYAMAEVLQWDLDFTRDLQPGDQFRLLFEEVWLDGAYHGLGRVLALSYAHEEGRGWEAYRFGDGESFYDAEGRPLQKMFLRSPLPYSRITSRFTNRRFHPVLKVFRPHYGVDYGAPVGTPVRTTASGTVTFVGWDGGGGKTVKVRHPNDYLTAYLHLSRYADVRAGTRVRQGDVVGYVGSTGLATAAHLDYRVQHRGRWLDPLSLASVPAEPLTAARLADFRATQTAMRNSLDTGAPYPAPTVGGDPVRVAAAAAPAVRAGK